MKGELDKDPKEAGVFIDEPNEAPNGDGCEALAIGCDCDGDGPLAPEIEPNGRDGEIENVEPPKLNEGDWPENRFCEPNWLPKASNGD